MTNVVSIGLPKRPNLGQRQSALLRSFAQHRRAPDDVFWLKENAEVLNILATSGAALPHIGLDAYTAFYETLEERMRFFPQYYRFLLSICLDLEDLGMPGNLGQQLCHKVHQEGFVEGELSDLQRAEAGRLIARRGGQAMDAALSERLFDFISHAETFTLPNKKASYELTHIVFYLSEYGARRLELPERAITSLEYAGLLAYLDQDVDLLSEVCVAMRFAGHAPSEIWENWIETELHGFTISPVPSAPAGDAYHEYLVTNWWATFAGHASFRGINAPGSFEIIRQAPARGPLRAISELMYQLGAARSAKWSHMRALLEQALPPEHHSILAGAEKSSDQFETFFQGFSRA
ncbi:MAG: hypothetical protein WBV78_18365 [Roseobacter sp.]